MPHPRILAAIAVTSLVVAAGCGGDDEKSSEPSSSTPAPSTAAQPEAGAPSPAGGVPSYEDVKKLALEDPTIKAKCPETPTDRDIGQSPAGETYKRMFCGELPIVDYTVGKGVYSENYKAAVDLSTDPVWHLEGEAYVKVEQASMANDFAEKIKEECGCGEVVPGGYGN